MPLTLAQQFNLAEKDLDFRGRICAASFGAAVSAAQATPLADPVAQNQRLQLANAIIRDRAYAAVPFSYRVVSANTINTEADLTDDTKITGVLTQNLFDNVARAMFPVIV